MVVSYCTGTETEPKSSVKAASDLNLRVICPDQKIYLFVL